MSATIQINGHEATITDGEWKISDEELEAQIAALALPQYLPDGAQAREVIAALGGTLLREDEPADDLDEDGEQVIH